MTEEYPADPPPSSPGAPKTANLSGAAHFERVGGCGKVGPTNQTPPRFWGTCGRHGLCPACAAANSAPLPNAAELRQERARAEAAEARLAAWELVVKAVGAWLNNDGWTPRRAVDLADAYRALPPEARP